MNDRKAWMEVAAAALYHMERLPLWLDWADLPDHVKQDYRDAAYDAAHDVVIDHTYRASWADEQQAKQNLVRG